LWANPFQVIERAFNRLQPASMVFSCFGAIEGTATPAKMRRTNAEVRESRVRELTEVAKP